MGWPRKNETARLYKEKREGAYFLIFLENEISLGYDAIANVLVGPTPSLGTTYISRGWIAKTWPKRVTWDELPEEWQKAFAYWLADNGQPFDPTSIRGFYRV